MVLFYSAFCIGNKSSQLLPDSYLCSMTDYLIVGLGLAGLSFCEQLEKNNKSFKVISDSSQTSSLVAAGLYNPVILKRFTLAWKANEQLDMAMCFYTNLEKKLNEKLDYKLPVFRRFNSVEEQNLWFEASDKKGLGKFLSTEIHPNTNKNIYAPFGYGEVLHTGRIDTKKLITSYRKFLKDKKSLLEETLDFDALNINKGYLEYKSLKAKRIVFAEGFGLATNPYFNYLPLVGSKGEYLFVKASGLREEKAIKSSLFIIPEGQDIYRVGANYDRNDKTNLPTDKGGEELLKKFNKIIRCDYEVVNHVAGVRPTVIDRKPMVGLHPEHQNLYVLNGFGSRGVMIAPYISEQLYYHIEQDQALDNEIDIDRFRGKYVMKKPL